MGPSRAAHASLSSPPALVLLCTDLLDKPTVRLRAPTGRAGGLRDDERRCCAAAVCTWHARARP